MKMKKGFGYLFTALVLMALAGNGCGKEEENAVKEPGGTPWPTAVFPATDVPEKTEDGQEEKANGQEGEKDVKKTEEGQDEKEDAEAAFKTDSPSLLLVTPVPQDAVKEIAGSIAPKDYPVVDGSTATLPLSQALYSYATGEGLAAAEAAIVHTKTTNSYYRLYNGEADLLIVYEPPQEIIDRMQTENLLVKPIGMDALVFMANEGNPVQSLTKQQLIDIYSGKIKNWKEVGGIYKALLAFQRPKGSGSQTLMQKLVMGDVEMEDGDNVYRYSTMADILEGMAAYSGEANTLGYSVFYYANFMYSLPKLRFMGVDGVMPSMQSIYDGSYPFVNAFYAVIRPDEPEDSGARCLFDWLTGQEGQQMVLDLGYVPVKMPDGVNIAQKEAERAGEPQVTPVKNLASGQHFILFQREPAPTHNFYGDLWIYDENWNCIDSFKAVNCSEYGVTDERYISIYRWKPDELRGEGEHTLYIYDLKEEKFIDLSGIISGEVMVLDGKKGYFTCAADRTDKAGIKVVDRSGNMLLDWVPYWEDNAMLYPEGDSYHVFYWYGDLGDNTGIISKIFDSDFRLKTIIYDEMADMPPKEQRMEGVNYIWGQEGCLLSAQGDVLLSKELFLAAFGNGTDTDCVIEGGETVRENKSSIKRLYQVTYAGETWYVDAARNAYIKEREERLHFLDEKKAGETCYAAWIQYGWKYFLPNGNPVVAATFKEEPDYISMCEDGSYVLARKTQQGYMVELAVPDDDFCANYQYESSKVKHLGIEYLEPYVVAMKGAYTDKDGGKREEVVIYKKSRAEVFTGEEVYFSQPKNQKTNEYEDVWIVTVYDGKSQTLTQENKVRKLYTYTVVMDGRARFTTPVPGEEVDYACHGGYLQINAGSYTYVYDYEGNQIIKAYNRIMVEE